jgi:hypothetical protein
MGYVSESIGGPSAILTMQHVALPRLTNGERHNETPPLEETTQENTSAPPARSQPNIGLNQISFSRDIAPILPRLTNLTLDPESGSLSMSVNPTAIKCSGCKAWFYDQTAFNIHRKRYPTPCATHNICTIPTDIYVHAQKYEHVQCFVKSCKSKYRFETNWDAAVIKKHIREAHYPRGGAAYPSKMIY